MKAASWIIMAVLAAGIGVRSANAGLDPVLDQQQTVRNLGSVFVGVDGTYSSAQTITPTLRYLCGVRYLWVGATGVGGNLTLEVWGFSIDNPVPTDSHVVLGSQTFTVTVDTEADLDFTSPIDLKGYLNTDGWGRIMLVFTSNESDAIRIGSSNSDLYKPGGASNGGALYGAWPTNWAVKNFDLGFKTYGLATLPPKGTAILIH